MWYKINTCEKFNTLPVRSQASTLGRTSVVTIHDLHATILYLMGMDHERLTYRWGGRDLRLTDVYGNVLHDCLT